MSDSVKRHAAIDPLSAVDVTNFPTQPGRVLGAPDAYRRHVLSAYPRTQLQQPHGGSTTQRSSPLRRPAGFPIAPHGFKLACPWTCYRKTYRLRYGADYWLTGAQQTKKPCDEVLVQKFPGTVNNDELQRLQDLRHSNVHAVLEVFLQDKTTHVVFEYMELSLHEIATVGVNTSELAAILGQVRLSATVTHQQQYSPLQVVDGLAYLSEQGLEHGSLTCSTILVSKEGAVKIGSLEPPTGVVLLTFLDRRLCAMPSSRFQ